MEILLWIQQLTFSSLNVTIDKVLRNNHLEEWFFYEIMKQSVCNFIKIRLQHKSTNLAKSLKTLSFATPVNDCFSKYISGLKVQSCKLYNDKYMTALTEITNTKIFTVVAVLVVKLLSRKVLFINRKYNRNY